MTTGNMYFKIFSYLIFILIVDVHLVKNSPHPYQVVFQSDILFNHVRSSSMSGILTSINYSVIYMPLSVFVYYLLTCNMKYEKFKNNK